MLDKSKKIKKNLTLMGLTVFFNNVNLYNVIAILYFRAVTGSFALGMSVFAVTTVSAAVFELPTGILSDRAGRKKTVVFGSVCSLSAAVVLFFANGYITLLLFAVINGAEAAFFSGNNDAYVYDNLKSAGREGEYLGFIGKVGSMAYLAAAVSGMLGAGLLYFFPYKVIIGLSIIPKAVQLIVSLRLGETERVKIEETGRLGAVKAPIKEVLKNKLILKKILSDGIMQSCNESCYQFRSAFFETVWPLWAVGVPGILANAGAFLSNWFSEKTIKKTTREKYWYIANFYSVLSNIAAVIVNNFISPFIMVSNSVCSGDFINSEVEQKLYRDEYRASMGSIKNLIQSLLFSVISVLLGLAADLMSIVASFMIFQLLKIIPIIISGKIIKKAENETGRK